MSIYIISNRKVKNDQFSNLGIEKAQREFRIAKATIEDDKEMADYEILEENSFNDYEEVVEILKQGNHEASTELKGTAAMFYDLYSQMLKIEETQSDCLFFIHGFANKFEDNLKHIKKLHDLYVKPADSGIDHIVYVAWPTIGIKAGTYWNDQNDAEETGRMLGGLFSKLFLFFLQSFEKHGLKRCSNRIHLGAHSMGNKVLEYMLHCIPEQKLFHLFGEILLFHSDVDHDIFEPTKAFSKLDEIGSRTHIYISQSDEVLGAISTYTKNFKKRLGHKGPKNLNALESQTFVIDTTNAGRGTSLREKTLDHWGYIERPAVIADVRLVFKGMHEYQFQNRKESKYSSKYFFLQS